MIFGATRSALRTGTVQPSSSLFNAFFAFFFLFLLMFFFFIFISIVPVDARPLARIHTNTTHFQKHTHTNTRKLVRGESNQNVNKMRTAVNESKQHKKNAWPGTVKKRNHAIQTQTQQQGVGRGRGTTARGRTVGHRGNSNRRGVPPGLRVGTAGAPAPVGAAVVVVPGVGRTRLSGRGTHQRAKPPPNIPGEDRPAFTLFSLFIPIFY